MAKAKQRLPAIYKRVANLIPKGKANARLMRDIMKIAGIDDTRFFYQIIESLINKHGYVIVGSKRGTKGYYIPANKSELEEARRVMKATIDSTTTRYENLLTNYEEMSK